jgi:hypothetical protein
MAGEADDVVRHFRVSYEAMARFPMLILPPLIVATVGFLSIFFVFGGVAGFGALAGWLQGGGEGALVGGLVGFVLGMLVFGLVMGILWLMVSGMLVVMARDALDGREPSMGDAMAVARGRLGGLCAASALGTLAVGVGFLLLVIPGLAAMVLLIFTLPALLLDGLGAVAAMKRSVAVVRNHLGPVIGLVVGSILVLVGVAIASSIARYIPFVGGLASLVLQFAAASYLTVVDVRFYRALAAS